MPEVDQYWRDDRSVGLADGRANGTGRDLLPLGEGDQVLVEPADFLRDVPREPQHLGGRVTRHELRLSIGVQARGKQATRYANHDCLYTRTTGIWQTVWLEAVPPVHLRRPRITPDVAGSAFHLTVPLSANRPGWKVRAILASGNEEVARAVVRADLDLAPRLFLPVESPRLWSTTDPHLYDVRLELIDADGNIVDAADSYAGLRSVSIDGQSVLINGERVFQRLVLDQGYRPDGLMTAPSEEALVADIELSLAAGFNGARPHQKVFEERFLYHADRLGYLVWGEFGDWGATVALALMATTSSRPRRSSPSGWRPSSATTTTRRSSAGAR
jgi:beta-galactosidase/beta-glucuronidase